MNKVLYKTGRLANFLGALVLLGLCFTLAGCKEDIDESNFKISEELTIADFIKSREDLSEIGKVFDRIPLGKTDNASPLTSVLSARGNYTCFLPDNEAVYKYVQSVTGGASSDVADLTDEQAKLIAYNCIIDNGSSASYETTDFPQNNETFPVTNLSDRRLSCVEHNVTEETENGETIEVPYHFINADARVYDADNDMSNGTVHIVDNVIAPSTDNLADLIKASPNMKVMGALLDLTGWSDSLKLRTDEEEQYEMDHIMYAGTTVYLENRDYPYMDKRQVQYTGFVETDQVFVNDWQLPVTIDSNGFTVVDSEGAIENWNEILTKVVEKCQAAYGTEDVDDFKSSSNAVNRFVAYHFIDGGRDLIELVHHSTEYGYDPVDLANPQLKNFSVNVWDYFTTKGDKNSHGLLKVTQLAEGEHDYYLNRISTYNDGIDGDYKETGVSAPNIPGQNGLNVRISRSNTLTVEGKDTTFTNNALNGFFFPIENVLLNDISTRRALGSERIRIDLVSMLPELASNDVRGKKHLYFPKGYFKNIMNESPLTDAIYLWAYYGGWRDYGGDEFLFSGRYDFVLRLPPVPVDGTYELRMAVSNNPTRGMAQIYIGTNPNRTEPCGLPIDMREGTSLIPGQPWVKDDNLDEATIQENDRNLRNQGYMKGPNYITVSGSAGKTTVRDMEPPHLRRILVTKDMKANETYYLRFKSCLESTSSYFFVDYFEYVPKQVYASEIPEDIW